MFASQLYESDFPSRPSALADPPQSRAEPLFEMLDARRANDGPVTREAPGSVAGRHSFATRKKFWKTKGSPSVETRNCWSPLSRLAKAVGGSFASMRFDRCDPWV